MEPRKKYSILRKALKITTTTKIKGNKLHSIQIHWLFSYNVEIKNFDAIWDTLPSSDDVVREGDKSPPAAPAAVPSPPPYSDLASCEVTVV